MVMILQIRTSLDIPFEYWIEHVTFGLPYVFFRFSTGIFYSGFQAFIKKKAT